MSNPKFLAQFSSVALLRDHLPERGCERKLLAEAVNGVTQQQLPHVCNELENQIECVVKYGAYRSPDMQAKCFEAGLGSCYLIPPLSSDLYLCPSFPQGYSV